MSGQVLGLHLPCIAYQCSASIVVADGSVGGLISCSTKRQQASLVVRRGSVYLRVGASQCLPKRGIVGRGWSGNNQLQHNGAGGHGSFCHRRRRLV